MSAIKFVLNVRDASAWGYPRSDREVTVIAMNDSEAKATYYGCGLRFELQVIGIKSVEVAKHTDLNIEGKDPLTYMVHSFCQTQPFIENIDPFPENCNPFHHDATSMGTSLPRRWMVMHDGYDRAESPFPLNHLYFVNTTTGRRVRVHLNDKV